MARTFAIDYYEFDDDTWSDSVQGVQVKARSASDLALIASATPPVVHMPKWELYRERQPMTRARRNRQYTRMDRWHKREHAAAMAAQKARRDDEATWGVESDPYAHLHDAEWDHCDELDCWSPCGCYGPCFHEEAGTVHPTEQQRELFAAVAPITALPVQILPTKRSEKSTLMKRPSPSPVRRKSAPQPQLPPHLRVPENEERWRDGHRGGRGTKGRHRMVRLVS